MRASTAKVFAQSVCAITSLAVQKTLRHGITKSLNSLRKQTIHEHFGRAYYAFVGSGEYRMSKFSRGGDRSRSNNVQWQISFLRKGAITSVSYFFISPFQIF